MKVDLRCLTPENWEECARLKVAEGQEDYVDTNLYAIAEAGVLEGYTPLAVLAEGEIAGLLVLARLSPERAMIHHVMISPEHQGRGYGRAALEAAIERVLADPRVENVVLSYWPGNPAAGLYESLGFRHTGEKWDKEPVMSLDLRRSGG